MSDRLNFGVRCMVCGLTYAPNSNHKCGDAIRTDNSQTLADAEKRIEELESKIITAQHILSNARNNGMALSISEEMKCLSRK